MSERPRLVISVPTLAGYVSGWTMSSILGLYPRNAGEWAMVEKRPWDLEILDTWLWPYDLARTRSRAARKFLETMGTHLLFIDSDVCFEAYVIRKMLETGLDLVSCPYPKRDVRWDLAYDAAQDGKHPEIGAYEYVYRALEPVDARHGVVRVSGVGMGCTLMSRDCIQRMTMSYPDLQAWDNHPTEGGWTTMFFSMGWGEISGKPHLYGEDLSFCNRWKDIGGSCWLYVGDGAPASHYGGHLYRGTHEGMAFDMARGEEGRKPR